MVIRRKNYNDLVSRLAASQLLSNEQKEIIDNLAKENATLKEKIKKLEKKVK